MSPIDTSGDNIAKFFLNSAAGGTALSEANIETREETLVDTAAQMGGAYTDLHINDTSAAHAASAIAFTATGAVAATDVQAAIAEVDSEKAAKIEPVNTVAAAGTTQTFPDPATSPISDITLNSAACAFTMPTATSGKSFTALLRQDATGSRTATWPAAVQWPGGTDPVLTTTASRSDLVSFVCIGGVWFGTIVKDFS